MSAIGAGFERLETRELLSAVPITDSLHAVGAGTIAATEGVALTQAVATFSDLNGAPFLRDYTAVIDWGDGSRAATGKISGPDAQGVFTITGTHTYAEESAAPETLTVTVDRPGAAGFATDTVKVADAPLHGGQIVVSKVETPSFTSAGAAASPAATEVQATFTDGDPDATTEDFTATIDWGDGTTTSGTVSAAAPGIGSGQLPTGTAHHPGFQVVGTHTYVTVLHPTGQTETNTDKITVVVHDKGGSSTTMTTSAAPTLASAAGSIVQSNALDTIVIHKVWPGKLNFEAILLARLAPLGGSTDATKATTAFYSRAPPRETNRRSANCLSAIGRA